MGLDEMQSLSNKQVNNEQIDLYCDLVFAQLLETTDSFCEILTISLMKVLPKQNRN